MKPRLPDRVGIALLMLVVAAPVGFSLGYALLYSIGAVGLLSEGITAEHWLAMLQRRELWTSLLLSLHVATTTLLFTTSAALALALLLRRPLERGPLSALLYVPLAIPGTVAAFLTFQLFVGGGLVERWVSALGATLGIATPSGELVPMVHDPWALGIVATHVALAIPFFALLFAELYRTEAVSELETLATSLGASRAQVLWRVTVPVLLRRASTNLVLFFIVVLGSFEIPLLLGRQTPQMLSVLTYRKFALFDLAERPEAYVLALIYTAVVFLLLALVRRLPQEGGSLG
ncbi:MAG: ABC transporter permease subunit [Acidobacteriota bacterium]